jgi:predicted MFS family arabinose efflux permease
VLLRRSADAPGFRWLWLSTGVSALGTFVGSLALAFTLVDTMGASPGGVAALGVVQLVAGLVAAPLAGVAVDRCRRRHLMIGADVVRALAIAVLPLAHHGGHLSLPLIAAVSAVTGAGNVTFNAAYQAHLPALVGRDRLVRSNATIAATVSLTEIAGFALAGWLVQWLGPPDALAVDAASFLVSAACVVAIGVPEGARRSAPSAIAAANDAQGGPALPTDAGRTADVVAATDAAPTPAAARARSRPATAWFAEATAGVRFAAREPVLRALLGTAAVFDASVAMIGVSYLLYLSGEVGFDSGLLGTLFAVGGVASIAGARLATLAERSARVGGALAAAGFVRTLGFAAMPAASSTGPGGVALLVGNQLVTDPAWMLQEVAEASVRQARSPDDVAGRVAAAHQLAGTGGRLAGTVAAGIVGDAFGPRWSLWAACALCGAASLALALSPVAAVRRAHEPPVPVAAGAG